MSRKWKPVRRPVPEPTPIPEPAPTASALPPRVIQGYFEGWAGGRLSNVHNNYNVIMWSFAVGVGTHDPGAIRMNFGSTNTASTTAADVQNRHAAGKKVILSIGGWYDLGGQSIGYQLKTTQHVDRLMATLVPIIDTYGFAGIDWDLEHGNNFTASAMIDASNRLKNKYGENFIIGAAPYGGANSVVNWGEVSAITTPYKDLALSLKSRLDLMSFQFYNMGTNSIPAVKHWANTYIARCGLQDSQWVFGFSVRDPGDPANGAVTPQFCTDLWNSWRADGRNARGMMLWAIDLDRTDPAGSYRWAINAGTTVLTTP